MQIKGQTQWLAVCWLGPPHTKPQKALMQHADCFSCALEIINLQNGCAEPAPELSVVCCNKQSLETKLALLPAYMLPDDSRL